jgi:hypothetical protein
MYGLEEKYARLSKAGTENVFLDREGFRRFVERGEKAFETEFVKQKAAAK